MVIGINCVVSKPPWISLRAETHRWDLTLHAALEYGKEHGKKVSPFLSAHQWTTRVPSEEEVEAVMQLGDAGPPSDTHMSKACQLTESGERIRIYSRRDCTGSYIDISRGHLWRYTTA
jgi:hypothetical protein